MVKKIGLYMAIFGALSIVLYFINYNLRILLWIDNWGDTIGWVIRIGLVVVGALLYFIIGKEETTEVKEEKAS